MCHGMQKRDLLPKRSFWAEHTHWALRPSEEVGKLFSNVSSDRARLSRPNISATAEFEANNGTDVTDCSIEAWFQSNRICEQQALAILIGDIWPNFCRGLWTS